MSLAPQDVGSSKHIHDEDYKRSLVGRSLVPFFADSGVVNEALDADEDTEDVSISFRPWNPDGYFMDSQTISKKGTGAPGAGRARSASPARPSKRGGLEVIVPQPAAQKKKGGPKGGSGPISPPNANVALNVFSAAPSADFLPSPDELFNSSPASSPRHPLLAKLLGGSNVGAGLPAGSGPYPETLPGPVASPSRRRHSLSGSSVGSPSTSAAAPGGRAGAAKAAGKGGADVQATANLLAKFGIATGGSNGSSNKSSGNGSGGGNSGPGGPAKDKGGKGGSAAAAPAAAAARPKKKISYAEAVRMASGADGSSEEVAAEPQPAAAPVAPAPSPAAAASTAAGIAPSVQALFMRHSKSAPSFAAVAGAGGLAGAASLPATPSVLAAEAAAEGAAGPSPSPPTAPTPLLRPAELMAASAVPSASPSPAPLKPTAVASASATGAPSPAWAMLAPSQAVNRVAAPVATPAAPQAAALQPAAVTQLLTPSAAASAAPAAAAEAPAAAHPQLSPSSVAAHGAPMWGGVGMGAPSPAGGLPGAGPLGLEAPGMAGAGAFQPWMGGGGGGAGAGGGSPFGMMPVMSGAGPMMMAPGLPAFGGGFQMPHMHPHHHHHQQQQQMAHMHMHMMQQQQQHMASQAMHVGQVFQPGVMPGPGGGFMQPRPAMWGGAQ